MTGASDDAPPAGTRAKAARTAASSFRASTRTSGGPSVIVRHAAASHIQAGSSRVNPGRSSTKRTSLPPRAECW